MPLQKEIIALNVKVQLPLPGNRELQYFFTRVKANSTHSFAATSPLKTSATSQEPVPSLLFFSLKSLSCSVSSDGKELPRSSRPSTAAATVTGGNTLCLLLHQREGSYSDHPSQLADWPPSSSTRLPALLTLPWAECSVYWWTAAFSLAVGCVGAAPAGPTPPGRWPQKSETTPP